MYKVCKEQHEGFNIIELTEGDYAGCKVIYGELKFADQENEDGSINMNFDYEVVNDFTVKKEQMEHFKEHLGNTLLKILEDAIAAEDVVYARGTNEGSEEVPLQNIEEK